MGSKDDGGGGGGRPTEGTSVWTYPGGTRTGSGEDAIVFILTNIAFCTTITNIIIIIISIIININIDIIQLHITIVVILVQWCNW